MKDELEHFRSLKNDIHIIIGEIEKRQEGMFHVTQKLSNKIILMTEFLRIPSLPPPEYEYYRGTAIRERTPQEHLYREQYGYSYTVWFEKMLRGIARLRDKLNQMEELADGWFEDYEKSKDILADKRKKKSKASSAK